MLPGHSSSSFLLLKAALPPCCLPDHRAFPNPLLRCACSLGSWICCRSKRGLASWRPGGPSIESQTACTAT